MKPDFDKCEKAATQLLLNQVPRSLSVDVRHLQYDRTILFDTIQNYTIITKSPILFLPGSTILKDGCMLKSHGVHVVLYNKATEDYPERLNWTLAHEVGHIYLGHTKDGHTEEIEANWFAAQLLMHENILRDMASLNHGLSTQEVADFFKVSITAAGKRINSLNRKTIWFCGQSEKRLIEKYRPLEYQALNLIRARSS